MPFAVQGRSLLPESSLSSSSSSFSIFETSLAIRAFPASTEVENEDDDDDSGRTDYKDDWEAPPNAPGTRFP